ncbi:MAG: hypothetical protein ACLUFV_03360 [Acutalibacteraceae bacterium]
MVREIYERYAAGETKTEIIRDSRDEKLKPLSAKSSATTV